VCLAMPLGQQPARRQRQLRCDRRPLQGALKTRSLPTIYITTYCTLGTRPRDKYFFLDKPHSDSRMGEFCGVVFVFGVRLSLPLGILSGHAILSSQEASRVAVTQQQQQLKPGRAASRLIGESGEALIQPDGSACVYLSLSLCFCRYGTFAFRLAADCIAYFRPWICVVYLPIWICKVCMYCIRYMHMHMHMQAWRLDCDVTP
jgi:hypothetical protein